MVPDPDVAPSLSVHWQIPLVTDTRRIRLELGYREPVGRPEGVRRSLRPKHVTLNGVKGTIPNMAPFAALRVTC